MLLTREYDYGWAKVPQVDVLTVEVEDALEELFSPGRRPVLYRVRLRVHTMHVRSQVRRPANVRARVWHRLLAAKAQRESGWQKFDKGLRRLPSRGVKGRARDLMAAKARSVYGD